MRTLAYTRGFVDRAASSEDTIRFVGATEGKKRDGIELRMDGADLERYQANPVFLYSHNARQLPIGRSAKTVVEGKKLVFDIAFDRNDEFAATVERKYRDGFLNAVSIGFAVDAWEDEKSNYFTGGVATAWELFELSGVTLPMDKDALKQSGWAWGVDDALLESLRDLLDRLDGDAITQLRKLLDAAGRTDPPPASDPQPPAGDPAPEPTGAGRTLAAARLKAKLAGI